MAKTKKPRNYAATESTLINLRATKKQITVLEERITVLEDDKSEAWMAIRNLEAVVKKLERRVIRLERATFTIER